MLAILVKKAKDVCDAYSELMAFHASPHQNRVWLEFIQTEICRAETELYVWLHANPGPPTQLGDLWVQPDSEGLIRYRRVDGSFRYGWYTERPRCNWYAAFWSPPVGSD